MRGCNALLVAVAMLQTASAQGTEEVKAILDAQTAALVARDHARLVATFSPDAIVLAPSSPAATPIADVDGDALALVYGSSTLATAKSSKLVVGAAWFAAELAFTYKGEKRAPKTIRVTALVDAAGKVVTAMYGRIESPMSSLRIAPLPKSTPAGPLTKFLTSPADAAAALSDDAHEVVEGTDKGEYAVGPAAAKKLLGSWGKLKLSLDASLSYEVRTKDWGYALGYVNLPSRDPNIKSPVRMSALVIAVPAGEAWKVVAVHYARM